MANYGTWCESSGSLKPVTPPPPPPQQQRGGAFATMTSHYSISESCTISFANPYAEFIRWGAGRSRLLYAEAAAWSGAGGAGWDPFEQHATRPTEPANNYSPSSRQFPNHSAAQCNAEATAPGCDAHTHWILPRPRPTYKLITRSIPRHTISPKHSVTTCHPLHYSHENFNLRPGHPYVALLAQAENLAPLPQ